jgi:predicted dehydrogenase
MSGTDHAPTPRRLRLGMVGGGQGAFIGAVHRMAARLDDDWELVAGALSSDPQRAAESAASLRLDPSRSHTDYRAMAQAEAQRHAVDGSGIDAVAIVTPNHLHAPVAHAFLDAGIHVICDKPLALTLTEARGLAAKAQTTGRVFAVTYNYSGYPMVRRARQLVKEGVLGPLRLVQVEYAQDWLSTALEADGQKQAAWRTDPALAGAAGCLGDIGTHAYQLACFVSGLHAIEVSAELSAFVPGRTLDDNVQAMLRFPGGVRGSLWASQVASGSVNGLHLRVYGELGSIAFSQEQPDTLWLKRTGGEETRLWRGRTPHGPSETVRVPAGHPEGFIEAFAQIYRDAATVIRAHQAGHPIPLAASDLTTVQDGVAGLAFVEAVLQSSASNGQWTVVPATD